MMWYSAHKWVKQNPFGSKSHKGRRVNKIVLMQSWESPMGQYSEIGDRHLVNITKSRSLTGNRLIWEDLNFQIEVGKQVQLSARCSKKVWSQFQEALKKYNKSKHNPSFKWPQLSSLSEICEAKLVTWALKNEQDFLTHKPWLLEKKDLKKQIFLNRKQVKNTKMII